MAQTDNLEFLMKENFSFEKNENQIQIKDLGGISERKSKTYIFIIAIIVFWALFFYDYFFISHSILWMILTYILFFVIIIMSILMIELIILANSVLQKPEQIGLKIILEQKEQNENKISELSGIWIPIGERIKEVEKKIPFEKLDHFDFVLEYNESYNIKLITLVRPKYKRTGIVYGSVLEGITLDNERYPIFRSLYTARNIMILIDYLKNFGLELSIKNYFYRWKDKRGENPKYKEMEQKEIDYIKSSIGLSAWENATHYHGWLFNQPNFDEFRPIKKL